MYYNEQKEYLEMKKAQFSEEEGKDVDIETRKSIMKHELSASWSRTQNASSQRKAANIRVLLLIAVIIILGYFLLYGIDEVDTVVEKMW